MPCACAICVSTVIFRLCTTFTRQYLFGTLRGTSISWHSSTASCLLSVCSSFASAYLLTNEVFPVEQLLSLLIILGSSLASRTILRRQLLHLSLLILMILAILWKIRFSTFQLMDFSFTRFRTSGILMRHCVVSSGESVLSDHMRQ